MNVKKWNELKNGELNFERICCLYSADKNIQIEKKPPFIRAFTINEENTRFEIRWNKHRADTKFPGERYCVSDYFILNGKCEITIDKSIFTLQKGDWLEIPICKYYLTVIGTEELESVAVYKLSKGFSVF
jgi:mannose-6-phosphate isomerase-like protein (cupin superfamily)